VNQRHGTPGPAIWFIVVASLAAMAWSGAVPVVTSLSTVTLYLAYIIPVILALRARGRAPSWTIEARWSAGRWGRSINIVAIVYTVFIAFVLVMPPNQLAGKTLAGVVGALILTYWLSVRQSFNGPEWARSSTAFQTEGHH
jgi:amino acid transporter